MAAVTIITSGRGSVGTMYSTPSPGTMAGSAMVMMLPLPPCTLQPPKHALSLCFWSRVPLKQSLTCPVASRFNHHCVTGQLLLQNATGVFLHLLLWEHDHWMLPGVTAHPVKTNTALREAKSQVMREAAGQHTDTKMNAPTS